MIKSMTAFGRERGTVDGKDITVEIRSVNNRFFDCSVKITRSFSYLEEKIKPYLQSKGISRGKVDVYISIDVIDSVSASIAIDEGYAEAYINALKALGQRFDLPNDISIMRVAQNHDIFITKRPEDDTEKEWQALASVLDGALEKFIAGRVREGENIKADLLLKIDAISDTVDKVEGYSLSDNETYREKLEKRLRDMLSDNRIVFDENRILTECAIFADKIAIDEELVRLRSHFGGFREIMESDEPAGRRLDFLLQEINRETNTIGSKCQNADIAKLVVNIKCELEKIREQIQNLE